MLPRVERVVRASALAVREMPYVDAARAAGYSHARIIFRHIVPNVVAPYLIMLTAFVAQAILAEASLSFLGLGVTEPTPSWGLMLSGSAADFYQQAPWMIVFPGIAISLGVFAFNLFGDCSKIKIQIKEISDFASVQTTPPMTCTPTVNPTTCEITMTEDYAPSAGGKIVQVQAYYRWPLVLALPYFNMKNQPDNYRLIGATRVFRNEPFTLTQ